MTDPIAIDLLSDVDAYLCALHVHVARHDQIGADLTCGGCVLRERIAAALPVLAEPAPDRAALRDRIAEALTGAYLTAPSDGAIMEVLADAVLAVLPPPADRAAVLREAIARVRRIPVQCTGLTGPVWFGQGWKDAIGEFEEIAERLADEDQRRLAAGAQPATRADTETLAAMFEGLGLLLATSSRDWGQYAPDAWLYAVVLGWDCEETEHDETCTHGAMEEMQQRHGWSDEAVAKARRYRAAVRALTEPATEVRPTTRPDRCPHGCNTSTCPCLACEDDEPEESGAALARYIADQPVSTIQSAFRVLGWPPLFFELVDDAAGVRQDGAQTASVSPTAVLLATRCDACRHTLKRHHQHGACTVVLCVCGTFQYPVEELPR